MGEIHKMIKASDLPIEEQLLEEKIYEYNSFQINQKDGELFTLLIRDEKDEIIGGISGWTWAKACEIKILWVHPNWRKNGYGRQLIIAAEEKAKEKNCEVILVSSYNFQAPEFYRKHGYTLVWTLRNFPPGYENHYFIKKIA